VGLRQGRIPRQPNPLALQGEAVRLPLAVLRGSLLYCTPLRFLVGRGHSSGDPSVAVQSIEQAIKLLKTPPPWDRDHNVIVGGLEALPTLMEWPGPETEGEDWLIAAATFLFVEPRRADRARRALRKALGGNRFEHLLGLLAFIRTAHYWTVLHPELSFEDDVRDLLKVNEELERLLLEDQVAARCDMGIRLFEELTELRELNEKHELERAKRALEDLVQQKDMLLKEVNHRVKNSLQIVSSILQLQVPHTQSTEAADALRSAAARVLAIAAVHERLYTGEDASVVRLDTFLSDLCGEIGRACGCPDGITTDVQRVDVPTDMAIPLALIVNELVTNVVKHVGPPCGVRLRPEVGNALKLTISDTGQGHPQDQPHPGLGTRIVDAFSTQLGAHVETKQMSGGYCIELTVPHVPTQR
jgi:two-component sensor histidine kinase